MKRLLTTIGAFLALLALVLVISAVQKTHILGAGELLETTEENILQYEDAGKINNVEIVKYIYKDGEAPAQKVDGMEEDIEQRKTDAQVFIKNSAENEFVARVYASDEFVKEGDTWYKLESATTTKDNFINATEDTLIEKILGFIGVHAISYYSGSGDGYVYKSTAVSYGNPADWSGAHDATVGSGVASTLTTLVVSSRYFFDSPSDEDDIYIYREFLPFNTSLIPYNATIDAASLKIYAYGIVDTANDAYSFIRVVQTNQASSTALSTDDYDNCGAVTNPEAGASDTDITGISTSAYTTITLNATGTSWIKKNGQKSNCGTLTGYTCLGLREGHDATNNAINAVNQQFRGETVNSYSSEQGGTGTTQDPYLDITYTLPDNYVMIQGMEEISSAPNIFSTTTNGTATSTAVVRSGSYSMLSPGNGAYAAFRMIDYTGTVGPANIPTALYNSFYMYVSTTPDTEQDFFSLYSSSPAVKMKLGLTNTGQLKVYNRSNTLIATSSEGLITSSTWHRFDVKMISGTSGQVTVWMDDNLISSTTSDFLAVGVQQINFGSRSTLTTDTYAIYFDDMVSHTGQVPGAGRALLMQIDSNGTYSGLSAGTGASNYTQVNQLPFTTNTYVSGTTTAGEVATSTFGLQSASSAGISGTVKGLRTAYYLRSDSTLASGVARLVIFDGSDFTAGDYSTFTTNNLFRLMHYDKCPSGSSCTISDLDNLQIGVSIGDGYTGGSARIYDAYLTVYFEESAPSAPSGYIIFDY